MASTEENTGGEGREGNMEKVEKNKNNPRFPFAGPLITPKNRRQYLENYKTIFFEEIKGNEKYESMSKEELEETSKRYAKLEVQREQMHHKAWLKGLNHYRFKGKHFPVLKSLYGKGVMEGDVYEQKLKESNEEE